MSVKDSRIEFANALKHLIKRENLEAVSVGEIAAEAGLSRQLFYKYFTDKYDLAFWCYMQMISPVAKAYIDGRISFHEQNVTMLNIFRNEPEFYKNLFQNSEVQNSFFQQYFNFSISSWSLMAGRKNANNLELYYLYRLYTYGCNHIVMDYIKNGMKEDVEFMADLFDEALPEKLRPIVNGI